MEENTFLRELNKHNRDKYILFYEPTHIYTILDDNYNKDTSYTSVTTWVHSHFGVFDADKIIDKMMESEYWVKNVYYGMTKEQIKNKWEQNRDEAAKLGTKLHYDIECYFNNNPKTNDTVEYGHFKRFVNEFLSQIPNLKPYRTEWMVWDSQLKLAGSIDMVFLDTETDTLHIYDWKRCKQIVRNKSFEKYGNKECISHIPDTNYWHYSLQLNTYKYILEQNYNKKVSVLRLVCLHPNKKSYEIHNVDFMEEEMKDLIKLREKEIKSI